MVNRYFLNRFDNIYFICFSARLLIMGVKEYFSDGIYSLMVRTYSLKAVFWSGIISLIIGIGLCFGFLWLIGTWDYVYDKEAYEKQSKENKAAFQAAVLSAEKNAKEAQVLREQNAALASSLRDASKKKDAEVTLNDQRRNSELQKINEQYNADVNSIGNMSDAERQQDICARLANLSADNPLLKQYTCQ